LLIFFFPETQYFRETSTGTPNPSSSTDVKESTSGNHKESTTVESVPDALSIPRKKPYLQELIPWSSINPGIEKGTSFLFLFIRPWPLILYPAVMYSTLVFSFVLGCILIVVNTAAATFQSPPYNMSPGVQSLIFLAGVIGSVIGAFVCGAITDLVCKWRSKKNNGIFEPESRLVMLLFPLFVVPAGVLM
jgi:MFS family permease